MMILAEHVTAADFPKGYPSLELRQVESRNITQEDPACCARKSFPLPSMIKKMIPANHSFRRITKLCLRSRRLEILHQSKYHRTRI